MYYSNLWRIMSNIHILIIACVINFADIMFNLNLSK